LLKKIKKIYDAVSVLVVIALVVLALLLVGVRLFGIKPFTVLSGSMEPRYHVGSVVYVADVRPEELSVGDALTFSNNGTVITHEIVEIIEADSPENMYFVTKGLTNNITDGRIPVRDIIGKPVFSIPYLGYVAEYFQKPSGLIGVVCAIVVLMAVSFILDIFVKDEKDADASEKQSSSSDSHSDPDESTDKDKK